MTNLFGEEEKQEEWKEPELDQETINKWRTFFEELSVAQFQRIIETTRKPDDLFTIDSLTSTPHDKPSWFNDSFGRFVRNRSQGIIND